MTPNQNEQAQQLAKE